MIKVTKIVENKDAVLRQNIFPDIWWNRFDLQYGNDFDLWKIESEFATHHVASHFDGNQIVVSMFLRRLSPSIFNAFLNVLFAQYKAAKSVYIFQSYTMCSGLEAKEIAQAELLQIIEDGAKKMLPSVPSDIKLNTDDIKTTTWTGTLTREQYSYSPLLETLAKMPKFTHKIIRFFLIDGKQKRAFSAAVLRRNEWLYLTDSDIGYDNTDRHSLSPSLFLHHLLPLFERWRDAVFADIGCGDGFVLANVANIFSKVIGVEYDARIAKICQSKKIKNAKIYNIDAAQIPNEILDFVEVFYLYNPFHGETFERFIDSVNSSLKRRRRKCLFVYANPTCQKSSDKLENFKMTQKIPTYGGFDILIYEFDAATY